MISYSLKKHDFLPVLASFALYGEQFNHHIPAYTFENSEYARVVKELDSLLSAPQAQDIIQQEISWCTIAKNIITSLARFGEVKKLAPKSANGQKKPLSVLAMCLHLLRIPLNNPLKRVAIRELHPLRHALINAYFLCTPLGKATFVFEKNPILSDYVLNLPTAKRLETAILIDHIIKTVALEHVRVPPVGVYAYRALHILLLFLNEYTVLKRENSHTQNLPIF